MLLPEDLQKRFTKCRDYRDVTKLTPKLGFTSHTSTSLVLSGKQHTTIEKIKIIKKFIERREKELQKLAA